MITKRFFQKSGKMQASDSEDDSMTVINLADWSDEEDESISELFAQNESSFDNSEMTSDSEFVVNKADAKAKKCRRL